MSKQDIVAEHCVAIAMAVMGLAGTAAAVPISLAVLSAVGLNTLRGNQKACEAAIASTLSAMQGQDDHALSEALDILQRTEHPPVALQSIPAPTDAKTLNTTITDKMVASLPATASFNAKSLLRIAFQHAVEACRYTPEIHVRITQDLLWGLMGQTAEARSAILEMSDMMQNRLFELEDVAQDLSKFMGMITGALIAYGRDVPSDKEATVKAIIQMVHDTLDPARQRPGDNSLDQASQELIAAVRAKRNAGQFDAALATLQEGRKHARAEFEQREKALLEEEIEIATLANNPEATAAAHLARLDSEHVSEDDGFTALCKLQVHYRLHGRDKGLAFEIEVAIVLGEACVARAPTRQQRGDALDALGSALFSLGVRERTPERLLAAAQAFKQALVFRKPDTSPREHAISQNNYGIAMRSLGERQEDASKLKRANAAFLKALEIYETLSLQKEIGETSMNLGNSLHRLWEMTKSEQFLQESLEALRKALDSVPYEVDAYSHAMVQTNLGIVLIAKGIATSDTDWVVEAVTLFNKSLEIQTYENAAVQWATINFNLGSAYLALAKRAMGTHYFEDAIEAYNNAAKVNTREDMPFYWAEIQDNLARTYVTYYDTTFDAALLDAASVAINQALDVFTKWGASSQVQQAEKTLEGIKLRRN